LNRGRFKSRKLLGNHVTAEQEIYVRSYPFFDRTVDLKFTHGYGVRQQPHFTVQEDRPNESYVEQYIQRLLKNKIAEEGRAHDVGDDVLLMGGRIFRRPNGSHTETPFN